MHHVELQYHAANEPDFMVLSFPRLITTSFWSNLLADAMAWSLAGSLRAISLQQELSERTLFTDEQQGLLQGLGNVQDGAAVGEDRSSWFKQSTLSLAAER